MFRSIISPCPCDSHFNNSHKIVDRLHEVILPGLCILKLAGWRMLWGRYCGHFKDIAAFSCIMETNHYQIGLLQLGM